MIDKKKVIITGCGRSGTLYMTQVLAELGFDIGHELYGEDGISSWYLVDEMRRKQVDEYINGNKKIFIHLVRNPLDVITSMYNCELSPNRAALDFVRKQIPNESDKYSVKYVAKWWLYWNKKAEKLYNFDMRIRVEDMNKNFQVIRLCQLLGIKYLKDYQESINELGENIHTIPKWQLKAFKPIKRLSFSDLVEIDPYIAHDINELAKEYGYQINDLANDKEE